MNRLLYINKHLQKKRIVLVSSCLVNNQKVPKKHYLKHNEMHCIMEMLSLPVCVLQEVRQSKSQQGFLDSTSCFLWLCDSPAKWSNFLFF